MSKASNFWPNYAKLAISISMQFEAGGEPEHGADSPFSGAWFARKDEIAEWALKNHTKVVT